METPRQNDEPYTSDATFVIMEQERVRTVTRDRVSCGNASQVVKKERASSYHSAKNRFSQGAPSFDFKQNHPMFKRSIARGDSLLLDAQFLRDEEADQLILQANRPPINEGDTFEETMQSMKAKEYFQQQFAKIQEQPGMNPRSLRFTPVYEKAYANYCQKSALLRVRFCFLLGMFSLGFYLWYDTTQPSYKATSTMPFWTLSVGKVSRRNILDVLSIIGPITFGIGMLLTNFKRFKRGSALEMLTFLVFGIVSMSLIMRKPVGRYRGPVLPLVILLIPVFGITRMRFQWSCIFGWSTFVLYLVIQLASKYYLDPLTSTQWDSVSDIVYQSINYGISIIGGMVSHYRQELLRRRNFALQLPFSGLMEDDSVAFEAEKFKKRSLLRRINMGFKNPEVEDLFYKHWYLIDPFPFKNPNEAGLHAGVFRVLRFPIFGLLVDQIILGIQDYKLLWLPGHPISPKSPFTQQESAWAYYASLICRYAIIVPCYMTLVGALYYLGNGFYKKWLEKANEDKLTEEEHIEIAGRENINQHPRDRIVNVVNLAFDVTRWRRWRDEKWTNVLSSKGGYVRYGQIYSSIVVIFHIGCVACLLLWVTRTTHKKQNVYFMGFINALLFPHRSGFRIRFIYATVTTVTLAAGFMLTASFILSPPDDSPYAKDLRNLWIEYSTYIVVVLLLGMFISREEESLRRSFFIIKSIRTLEFEEWFHTILKVQGWMRAKLKSKLDRIRARHQSDDAVTEPKLQVVKDTSPYMGQASKYGIYAQSFNFAAVLIDLLVSMSQS